MLYLSLDSNQNHNYLGRNKWKLSDFSFHGKKRLQRPPPSTPQCAEMARRAQQLRHGLMVRWFDRGLERGKETHIFPAFWSVGRAGGRPAEGRKEPRCRFRVSTHASGARSTGSDRRQSSARGGLCSSHFQVPDQRDLVSWATTAQYRLGSHRSLA